LNSRSSGKGVKAPLKQSNFEIWQSLFKESKHYLMNLFYDEKNDGNRVRLMTSRKGTAFKGLFITITSFELMMSDIIFNPDEDLWLITFYSRQCLMKRATLLVMLTVFVGTCPLGSSCKMRLSFFSV